MASTTPATTIVQSKPAAPLGLNSFFAAIAAAGDSDSEIEEIPRPDLQPQQHYLHLPPTVINTTPWQRCKSSSTLHLSLITTATN